MKIIEKKKQKILPEENFENRISKKKLTAFRFLPEPLP